VDGAGRSVEKALERGRFGKSIVLVGAHEVFHFFVLVGSMAHYRSILKIVVPFAPAA
jgi:hypothetical protein